MTAFRPTTAAILAIMLAIGTASPIKAQAAGSPQVCAPRAALVERLRKKYGETRRSIGLQRGRGVVEIYASARTGSWSILVTNTKGRACLVAAGEAFETLVETPRGPAI